MNISNMDEIKSRTLFLKVKFIEYEKEYLKKKSITNITPDIRNKMSKAISRRLKNEISELNKLQLNAISSS